MNHLLLSRYGADIPLTADVTVHASALSLAQQIARADVCRRLAGG